MKDGVVLTILAAAAVLVLLIVWGRICSRWRRKGSEVTEAQTLDHLLNPDWAFYERHLQRPAPPALRELYGDESLLRACAFYKGKREEINSFEPLDESSLVDTPGDLGHEIVPIATSVCGDPIYLRPGAAESNKVYIAYHDDPGNVEVFAESVDEILEWRKRAEGSRK